MVATDGFLDDHASPFGACPPIDDNDATVEVDDDQGGTHLTRFITRYFPIECTQSLQFKEPFKDDLKSS